MYGECSSAGLERRTVDPEVGGSNPLTHPVWQILRLILFLAVFPFFLFGMGARPLAMESAYVPLALSLNPIFYNPAYLAITKGKETSYIKVLNNRESISFKESIAFYNRTKGGGIGCSYLNLVNVDWENGYADLNYNKRRDDDEPYLGSDDRIVIFTIGGYGEGSLKRTAFGINFKRYSQSLIQSYGIGGGFSKIKDEKKGFGVDIGILHHLSKNISLGFVIYDLNEPKFVYEGININGNVYDYKITHPLVLLFGICLKPDDKTALTIDLYGINNINDWYSKDEDKREQSSVRFGFEKWVGENFAVRGGYGGGFHSAGFGIKMKHTRFDYSIMEKENLAFHFVYLMLTK